MAVGFAFALNALFNFLVGLLVAKFLGPAEFGRFAIASATAVIVNSGGFDWIRLAAGEGRGAVMRRPSAPSS